MGKTRRQRSVENESREHAHRRDGVMEQSALAEGFHKSWGDTGHLGGGAPNSDQCGGYFLTQR